MRFRNLLPLLTATALAVPAAAPAAPLAPFATVEGTCDREEAAEQTFTGDPVDRPHPAVIVQFLVHGGRGSLDGAAVEQRDVSWAPRPALAPGDRPSVVARCDGSADDMPFTARFFDRPSAPASFSGIGGRSELVFGIPGAAEYEADVTVEDGKVELRHGSRAERLDGPRRVSLGRLSRPAATIVIEALDGGDPEWSISIRALPTNLSGVAFSAPFVGRNPPAHTDLEFTTSGDSDVTVDVVESATGRVVRRLANAARVSGYGRYSWDATDPFGRPVDDGHYQALVSGMDPAGHASAGDASLVVDRTDPIVGVLSARRLLHTEPLQVGVGDATSGLASASATTTGGARAGAGMLGSLLTLRPPGGWAPGRHAVAIHARDHAGNEVRLVREVTIVRGQRCDATAATRAVRASRSVLAELRRGRVARRRPRAAQVLCSDLDADGPPEMAVLVRGRRGRTGVAVFSMSTTTWRPRLRTARHRVAKLALRGGALVVERRGGLRALRLRVVRGSFTLR